MSAPRSGHGTSSIPLSLEAVRQWACFYLSGHFLVIHQSHAGLGSWQARAQTVLVSWGSWYSCDWTYGALWSLISALQGVVWPESLVRAQASLASHPGLPPRSPRIWRKGQQAFLRA